MNTELLSLANDPAILVRLCDIRTLPSTDALVTKAERILAAEEISSALRYRQEDDKRMALCSRLLQQQLLCSHSSRHRGIRSVSDLLRAMDSQCVGRERPYVFGGASGIGEEEKLRRFMKIWTMKEAFVKALGTGVYVDPARLECVLPEFDSPEACTPAPSLACPYTPEYDLSTDTYAFSPAKTAGPSVALSSGGSTSASTQETFKSLSLESEEDTGKERKIVRILMDGEEQKDFGFVWLDATVAPGFVICVCWGPVQAAQKKYLECMPEREREAIKSTTARRISRDPELPKRFSWDEALPSNNGGGNSTFPAASRLPRFDVRWVSGETLLQELHTTSGSSNDPEPNLRLA
ncbi:putative 4'-phosphopantetheinyl transferase [Neospora caninum Liverpool]|uniref:holo-[acyl-carrier-protein] synthase n=1 Tax=Neospora caninum (strain Liverpool) TaxID=572307 RepID=F0VKY4_NEOCL|nr:putative 4'-phosphopantetheinyl transferase [Neospora caninum Liverpool]CBZ54736.1 putative 4'-phosphopantetheinyl transferase [Neospora caninum Liverpool]|eukprot:XP_003884764.1 putative 4'-phosphopantetheinyl transferase [Neospora caninum Liverpool]